MLPSASESLQTFEAMLFDACALLRPPEKLTVSEWADKYAYLSVEGSSRPGKWFTSNAEYQRYPMDLLTPGSGYETVVLKWASQVGKTQIGLHFLGYNIHHDPQPFIFVEPTEDLCKVIARDRVEPMIRDTPVLKPLFGQKGGRNSGNDTLTKYFPGGSLTFAWANSPSQLASRARGRAVTDEEGRMEANKEGDPIGQLRKRMATYKNRKHLRVSSPGLARTCRITKAHDQSDQFNRYLPCPDCSHKQILRFEQLKWIRASEDPGVYDLTDCWYECEACGYHITETDKFLMDRTGEWRLDHRGGDGKTAGFQLSSLYSTIGYTWAEIAAEYLQCEGIPDRVQVFQNTVLAEAWDEQAEGADLNEVAKHAEIYAAEAPAWVCLVTLGADVQKNRLEGSKFGWGLTGDGKEQCGLIEHRIFHGDPERPDVWMQFDAWRRQEVAHESGLTLPTAMTLIDSGDGNRTEAVYRYTRPRAIERVFACKGSSQNGAPLVNRGSYVGQPKTLLVSVGTSTAKDMIYGRLQIVDRSAAGYIHFPDHPESGCDAKYFAQLTAEKLVTRRTKSGEESRWECQDGKRNEALDCAVYNFAARAFLRFNMRQLHKLLWARVAKLREVGKLPATPTPGWTARTDKLARVVDAPLQSTSTESSPASPLQQQPQKRRKKGRKRLVRPGLSWINQY